MSTFLAFLHHAAAFGFVAALSVELALLREPPDAKAVQRLVRADIAAGVLAGILLAVGIARVLHFEKGPAYYSHSAPFIAKMTLFGLVALLSIYPTVTFIRWRSGARRGEAPSVTPEALRRLRMVLHAELTGVVLIALAAAMMARGVGYFG